MFYVKGLGKMIFVLSLFMVALGVTVVTAPVSAASIIVYVLAAMLICFGLFNLITYFINKEDRKTIQNTIIMSAEFFLMGIFMFFKAAFVVDFLSVVFGMILTIDGLSKIVAGIEMKETVQYWKSVLLLGLVIFAAGVIVLFDPFTALKASMIVVGISLICDGLFNIWAFVNLRKHQKIKEETALANRPPFNPPPPPPYNRHAHK